MVTQKQRKARELFVKRVKSGYFRKKHKRVIKYANVRRNRGNDMARRRRGGRGYRTVTRYVRRGGRSLGGGRSILNKVLIGFGASSLGGLVASRFGVNPTLVGGALGYVSAGPVGAISAIAIPMLANTLSGPASTASAGTVWA